MANKNIPRVELSRKRNSKEKVLFLIIGVLGSIFLIHASFFLKQYDDNRAVDISEAHKYEGEFDFYVYDNAGRVSYYYIVLKDGTKYLINPLGKTDELYNTIKSIKEGSHIVILIHPQTDSDIVSGLVVDGEVVMDFYETQKNLVGWNIYDDVLFWTGVVLFVSLIGYNTVAISLHLTRKRQSGKK